MTERRLVIGEPTGALRVEVTPGHHPERVRPATLKNKLHAYFALTKPRIIELLLITTVPAMIVAERGLPSLLLIAATLLGGSLAAGGANAINCYVDRDIDEIMPRTRRRPLPQHKISPPSALRFGAALGLISFGFLWATVNWYVRDLGRRASLRHHWCAARLLRDVAHGAELRSIGPGHHVPGLALRARLGRGRSQNAGKRRQTVREKFHEKRGQNCVSERLCS